MVTSLFKSPLWLLNEPKESPIWFIDATRNHELMQLQNNHQFGSVWHHPISSFHRGTTGPQIWAQLPQIRSKHFLRKRAMAGAW